MVLTDGNFRVRQVPSSKISTHLTKIYRYIYICTTLAT
jgi:hypothetical protein